MCYYSSTLRPKFFFSNLFLPPSFFLLAATRQERPESYPWKHRGIAITHVITLPRECCYNSRRMLHQDHHLAGATQSHTSTWIHSQGQSWPEKPPRSWTCQRIDLLPFHHLSWRWRSWNVSVWLIIRYSHLPVTRGFGLPKKWKFVHTDSNVCWCIDSLHDAQRLDWGRCWWMAKKLHTRDNRTSYLRHVEQQQSFWGSRGLEGYRGWYHSRAQKSRKGVSIPRNQGKE